MSWPWLARSRSHDDPLARDIDRHDLWVLLRCDPQSRAVDRRVARERDRVPLDDLVGRRIDRQEHRVVAVPRPESTLGEERGSRPEEVDVADLVSGRGVEEREAGLGLIAGGRRLVAEHGRQDHRRHGDAHDHCEGGLDPTVGADPRRDPVDTPGEPAGNPVGRDDVDRADGVVVPLQLERARVDVRQALHLRRQVDHRLGREDLAGLRLGAEPGSEVQGAAAVAPLDRDRLARVQADPHPTGQVDLLEAALHGDRGAERLPRGHEHHERLVASELEEEPFAPLRDLADGLGEPCRQLAGRLVAVLARVGGVAADVGDHERAELRAPPALAACAVLGIDPDHLLGGECRPDRLVAERHAVARPTAAALTRSHRGRAGPWRAWLAWAAGARRPVSRRSDRPPVSTSKEARWRSGTTRS